MLTHKPLVARYLSENYGPFFEHYEKLLKMYPDLVPWLEERVKNRISELKEEIHFGSN